MLILTRRMKETLTIGSEITVTVLGVKGNQVRLGIGAPKNVEVHREEIYARIHQETAISGNEIAASTSPAPIRVKKSKIP